MGFVEAMAIEVSRATVPDRPILAGPVPACFTYDEAIERFGSDKPDIRFGMELVDLAPGAGRRRRHAGVGVPRLRRGARGRRPGQGDRRARAWPASTRREIDELTERAKRFGAKGLAHLAVEAGGELKGPIAKFLGDETQRAIVERTGAARGRPHPDRRRHADGHRRRPRPPARGARRPPRPGRPERPGLRLGQPLPDVPVGRRERPLGRHPQPVQRRPARGRGAARDGLRRPRPALARTTRPAGPARMQYDLALNGWELGRRVVRIHRRDLLERSFRLQGQSLEGMREKFGAILDAFEYGAPPHGGIALGIDRWAALFAEQTNIREVMAFPKTQSGDDPMLEAPSAPEPGPVRRSSGCGSSAPERAERRRGLSRCPRALSPARSTGSRDGPGSPRCSARSASRSRGSSTSGRGGLARRPATCLPLPVRPADPGPRRAGRAAALRPAAARGRSGSPALAGVFFAGDLLSCHHAVDDSRGGPRDGAGQPAGRRRRRSSRGCCSGSGRRGRRPARPAGRARRGRADLGRDRRRRVRRGPAARASSSASSRRSATRATCSSSGGRSATAPAGRPGRDRDDRRRRWSRHRRRGTLGRRPRPRSPRAGPACIWLALLGVTSAVDRLPAHPISLPRLPAVADLGHPARPAGR